MIKAAVSHPRHLVAAAEQLTLLPTSPVKARFVLSKSTRERGLRHVAEIRQQLADRNAVLAETLVRQLPARHDRAA